MKKLTISEELPELYKNILPEFFEQEIFPESMATCSDCAMVCTNPDDRKNRVMKPFLPDRKCCTYYPTLPNYLVGAILSDTSGAFEEGKKRIRRLIKSRRGITPLGITAPKKYAIMYRLSSKAGSGFGNSSMLICPLFDREKGNCTIWKYRNAVCSTYFCKKIAGVKGSEFWAALNSYLMHLEQTLTQHAADTLNMDVLKILSFLTTESDAQGVIPFTTEDLDDLPPLPETYSDLWKEWEHNEEEYYIRTFSLTGSLRTSEAEATGGIRSRLLLRETEKKYRNMMLIPEYLTINHSLVTDTGRLYNLHLRSIDTVYHLPKNLLDHFDGSDTFRNVLNLLEEKEGISLDESFIFTLYHYGILIAPPSSAQAEMSAL